MSNDAVFKPLGASNHTSAERAEHDYYATDPKAVDILVHSGAKIDRNILEPMCGDGCLSKRLEELGFNVTSHDLVDRGYGTPGIDFLNYRKKFDGDIITNPAYSIAQESVEHALEIINDGHKVFMLLKLTFLEGKKRRKLFDRKCLKTVYVSSSRIYCVKNGDFEKARSQGSAVAYAWYEFEKGYDGDPVIKWVN